MSVPYESREEGVCYTEAVVRQWLPPTPGVLVALKVTMRAHGEELLEPLTIPLPRTSIWDASLVPYIEVGYVYEHGAKG